MLFKLKKSVLILKGLNFVLKKQKNPYKKIGKPEELNLKL